MATELHTDLQRGKPAPSPHQELYLSVVRTGTLLQDAFERMLKPYGISGTQYNVLRILRGAEPAGLCRNELRERLVSRMPDVTRLLDRMEALGLVSRLRDTTDRRQVATRLTRKGRRIVDDLDEAVVSEHHRCLGHMNKQQLAMLIDLLAIARSLPLP